MRCANPFSPVRVTAKDPFSSVYKLVSAFRVRNDELKFATKSVFLYDLP